MSAGSVTRHAARATLGAGCAALLAAGALAAQGGTVVCRSDDLSVAPGGSTRLRVLTDAAAGAAPRFTWTVTAGTLSGEGADVTWTLAGVAPGAYEATARAPGADSARFAPCTVQVVVAAAAPADSGQLRNSPLSGGGQLVGAAREGTRYGLYSYLLFRAPPTDVTRERYVAIVSEYLRQMPAVAALQEYRQPEQLNVTYVPLVRRLRRPTTDSVLAAYNYPRALVLLQGVPGARGDGPFLVSSKVPLGARAPTDPLLVQDLSAVPPRLAGLWMSEFVAQAAQERFWEPRTVRNLALRLRTSISVVGAGLGDVRKALDDWISWSEQ